MSSCAEAAAADVDVSLTLPRSTAFDHCDQTCDTQSAVQEGTEVNSLRVCSVHSQKGLSMRSSGRTSVSLKLLPP